MHLSHHWKKRKLLKAFYSLNISTNSIFEKDVKKFTGFRTNRRVSLLFPRIKKLTSDIHKMTLKFYEIPTFALFSFRSFFYFHNK